ncbi:MAG: type III toxin-antitoxin system ToxN/AbiQ family toxin [Defluviitaleaceae bacterium]|nr:type III toxin-antitoxin system ToxN/AbiQ family toxin [Defluviitaleaceae bacterium]
MNLKLYTADVDYCKFLQKIDKCVPYIHDEKHTRPFIGILLSVNGLNYFAPLASPKPKHKGMKNQIDFIKIKGGEWGVINLNNMIPIHPSCLTLIDLKICPTDSKSERDYKHLLIEQLSWCTSNKTIIANKAAKLYEAIVSDKARPELVKRCCNFLATERQYYKYCSIHGLENSQK